MALRLSDLQIEVIEVFVGWRFAYPTYESFGFVGWISEAPSTDGLTYHAFRKIPHSQVKVWKRARKSPIASSSGSRSNDKVSPSLQRG
ncbi:hypothetical protein [Dryocola sp. BD626]|uniref:hypothetical protein n=1 Tax=Dryocola sp. BD626 TaxID=3133273 RepID=UPI003F502BF3